MPYIICHENSKERQIESQATKKTTRPQVLVLSNLNSGFACRMSGNFL